jgi:hypothetical protein
MIVSVFQGIRSEVHWTLHVVDSDDRKRVWLGNTFFISKSSGLNRCNFSHRWIGYLGISNLCSPSGILSGFSFTPYFPCSFRSFSCIQDQLVPAVWVLFSQCYLGSQSFHFLSASFRCHLDQSVLFQFLTFRTPFLFGNARSAEVQPRRHISGSRAIRPRLRRLLGPAGGGAISLT